MMALIWFRAICGWIGLARDLWPNLSPAWREEFPPSRAGDRARGSGRLASVPANCSRRWPTLLLWALLVGSLLVGACQPGPAQQAATRPAGQPATKVSVALDWYPWSSHTGLYLAKENGYYAAEGLDVDIYVPANPEDVLKLVGSGKDTFGISYQTDVLLARSEGVPVKSIAALVQHPLNSIMTLRESGILHPKQLEGKKVGTPGIPSDDAYLATMLEADGADPRKVEVVNVGFDLVPALIGKKVDAIIGAYWVHESILAELKGYPVNVMKVEDWGVPDYYELVLVANDGTVKNNPDVAQRFLRATLKGYQDAMRDHARALDVLVKASPETDRQLETRGIKLLAPLWLDKAGAFGVQAPERWQTYADWMKERGLLKAELNPADAFTTQFVPEQQR